MDISLLLDLYELTMAQCYFFYKKKATATFELFVREMPERRAFLLSCGLQDILDYIRELRFKDSDLNYLKKLNIFSKEFLKYLSAFRFRGELWAMPEGEVFFANEPLLRVSAPIIEAQVMESFLLNTINLQTMIASKAARVVCAAEGKKVYDFSLRRAHGADAGVKVARASYVAGFSGTSNVLAAKLYKIPAVGTMAHSFVMSFKQEMDSFLAYAHTFPDKTILLVDTYDTKKGIRNAIKAGLYLKERGFRLLAIRLDSGDIVSLSKLARAMLDRAGLDYVKIFASGNLDEFRIKDFLQKKAKIDFFGVGTHMGVSIDAPCLDVIYKISEVSDEKGRLLPTMKLSRGKVTYPGRKQVFRIKDKSGYFRKDVLGLQDERIKGLPLLKKVIAKGKIIYKKPQLSRIRGLARENLAALPRKYKEVYNKAKYPVILSAGLKRLTAKLSRSLKERQ